MKRSKKSMCNGEKMSCATVRFTDGTVCMIHRTVAEMKNIQPGTVIELNVEQPGRRLKVVESVG